MLKGSFDSDKISHKKTKYRSQNQTNCCARRATTDEEPKPTKRCTREVLKRQEQINKRERERERAKHNI